MALVLFIRRFIPLHRKVFIKEEKIVEDSNGEEEDEDIEDVEEIDLDELEDIRLFNEL